jgi:sugar phosphate isomerase/epimerase
MVAEPNFAVSEITTFHLSFDEEVELLAEVGVRGLGLFEPKLPEGKDAESARKLGAAGITATVCIPAVFSILPLEAFPGPADPQERIEAICASIRRFAEFQPVTTMCLTGPLGGHPPDEARRIVVEGLRKVARAAAEARVPIGLEAIHRSAREAFTLVSSIPEAVELIEEVGEANLGILFDTWHHWDTPGVLDDIRREGHRFVPAIHIDDWRGPTRSWCDRALPGEGIIDLPALLGALDDSGWEGDWFELEIFSDDGSVAVEYPDSLWKVVSPTELVERGRTGFLAAWEERTVAA